MTFRPTFTFPKYHVWHDDFDDYVAAEWTITTTEVAGTATEAVSLGARGGVLVLTNGTNEDDLDFLQWSGATGASTVETFKYVAGKKLYFEARFKVSDATQSDFILGLQITDVTALAVSDGIYFQKDDGDTNLDFHVTKNATSTSKTAIHTMVDDTYVRVAFYYPGSGNIKVYINGVMTESAALTNVPDDEELAISFGIQNGAAAAKIMSIDYIYVAEEREIDS